MDLVRMRPRPGSVIVGEHIWWTGQDQVSYVATGGPERYLISRTSDCRNLEGEHMNVPRDWLDGLLRGT